MTRLIIDTISLLASIGLYGFGLWKGLHGEYLQGAYFILLAQGPCLPNIGGNK